MEVPLRSGKLMRINGQNLNLRIVFNDFWQKDQGKLHRLQDVEKMILNGDTENIIEMHDNTWIN